MNKRQRKKDKKKRMEFEDCYVSSYRELRELDRKYHEFKLSCDIMKKCNHVWDISLNDFFKIHST